MMLYQVGDVLHETIILARMF